MATVPVWVAVVCTATRGPNVARLVQAFAARGVPAHPLRPAEVGAALVDPGRRPTALLTRLPSGTPRDELDALLATLTTALPSLPPWINAIPFVAAMHDKQVCCARLAAAGLPVPPTLRVLRDGPVDLDLLPGRRYVVKPVTGAAGHGVTMSLSADEALRRARAFAELVGAALVQPMLGDGLDRRLVVVGDAVVAAMERRPRSAGERGSILYGGRAGAWEPSPAQRDLALAAARTLGLDVAAVDLVQGESGDEPGLAAGPRGDSPADPRGGGRDVILEVNSCPGFAALAAATGRDLSRDLAEFTCERAGLR